MRVRWTTEAADDLDRICSHIAEDSPEFALKIGRILYRGIAGLTAFPNLGRTGRRIGTRELVFTPLPYIVVYRIREQNIHVLHIWHGAQNKR